MLSIALFFSGWGVGKDCHLGKVRGGAWRTGRRKGDEKTLQHLPALTLSSNAWELGSDHTSAGQHVVIGFLSPSKMKIHVGDNRINK